MIVVIMAGGKGTRIASINANVPKPMVELYGKPILQYQIECFAKQGYDEFIIVTGHLGQIIREYFKDGGAFGASIRYINEDEPLGTGGALYYLKDEIKEDFLLINGDILFDIYVDRFYKAHLANPGLVTVFTHPNDHPYDSGVIQTNADSQVVRWLHKEDDRLWYQNRVNAGLHFISPRLLDRLTECRRLDLDREVLMPLIAEGTLYAYDSPEYVRDVGTPDRYRQAINDIGCGLVQARSMRNLQRAVFLDRDGTINHYVGFLRKIDDFELINGIAEKIKKINQSSYLAIVVTNQPVIARGEITWDELQMIHNKMETLLGRDGAYLNDIFVCPHHPDKGFAGECPEYKIECHCRKPKPGMLLQAAAKYNIDLSNSYMVGDSESDMEAGRAAGCQCVRVAKA